MVTRSHQLRQEIKNWTRARRKVQDSSWLSRSNGLNMIRYMFAVTLGSFR